MARIQPGESPGARLVEPKASQRASASSRGGVRRKPKAKTQGDEQESDMRLSPDSNSPEDCLRQAKGRCLWHRRALQGGCIRDERARDREVLYLQVGGNTNKDAFCKSGVYARKDSCLTTGDLPCVVAA